MKQILFPYGKTKISHAFEDGELTDVLTSAIEEYRPGKSSAAAAGRKLSQISGRARSCSGC